MTEEEFKKLKVGDTIKFKKDLIFLRNYGHIRFLYGMAEQIGEKRKILEISPSGLAFKVNDPYGFYYSIEMIENTSITFKFGK